ncbi:WD repeat-containing protein 49-like isoform X1 [Acipenser oxyrinchus oxyrinchus]|uniref:WD repeat-containing protein 49-like isoform X1 n=1 Tax=Acipenser oxyrinchus oxyrinchus TaxID=40147 RepID=A0AAD8G861_ACIOX|nr:WD repeat-containing protein 49-like isoform X1 [Acipenser oxyrinchus oxyrinchus]
MIGIDREGEHHGLKLWTPEKHQRKRLIIWKTKHERFYEDANAFLATRPERTCIHDQERVCGQIFSLVGRGTREEYAELFEKIDVTQDGVLD